MQRRQQYRESQEVAEDSEEDNSSFPSRHCWRDLPERYGPRKTFYNRFNRWSKSGAINIIFNRLLSSLDAHGLVDWSTTALDGSNIRVLRCAAGAKINIPISPEIMGWVALAVVLAPKSIWRQTEVVCR
jgi:putative transposase